MKAGGMFVSAILIIDTFFVSYYLGVHSRTVDVEDPTMKPVEKLVPPKPPAEVKAAPTTPDKAKAVQPKKPATTTKQKPKAAAPNKGTKTKQAAKKE
jgi:hypothetical protein